MWARNDGCGVPETSAFDQYMPDAGAAGTSGASFGFWRGGNGIWGLLDGALDPCTNIWWRLVAIPTGCQKYAFKCAELPLGEPTVAACNGDSEDGAPEVVDAPVRGEMAGETMSGRAEGGQRSNDGETRFVIPLLAFRAVVNHVSIEIEEAVVAAVTILSVADALGNLAKRE